MVHRRQQDHYTPGNRTSRYPQAILGNLRDGYPNLSIDARDKDILLEVEYPESIDIGLTFIRAFFGWIYVIIPHGFCLLFRMLICALFRFAAWWIVLFTGNYPKSMHDFQVGTIRWSYRVYLYIFYLTDEYPPFSGKE